MTDRHAALLWAGITAALLILLAWQAQSGIHLDTDLLSLLPRDADEPLLRLTSRFLGGETARSVLLAAENVPAGERQRVRSLIESTLEDNPVVDTYRTGNDPRSREAFAEFYFPFRYQLLAPGVRRILRSSDPAAELTRRLRRRLLAPGSSMESGLLDRDPLLLFPGLIQHWSARLSPSRPGDRDGERVFAVARLADDPYRVELQDRVTRMLDDLHSRLGRTVEGARLSWTGVVKFARSMRQRMQRDLRWIGMLSVAAVVLLVLLAFRSPRHLMLLGIAVGTGLLAAFTLTNLLWHPPHLFTVVFSTSLLGVSVDYAFHYFTEVARPGEPAGRGSPLRAVLPGITLGMVTTVLGYLGLFLTPLPILRQMAFFSAVGIIGAFGTVVMLFPLLLPGGESGAALSGLMRRTARSLLTGWAWLLDRPGILLAAGMAVFLTMLGGLGVLTVKDDVRTFQEVPPDLLREDRRLRSAAGRWNSGRYVAVRGQTSQQVLRRLETLIPRLRTLREEGAIEDHRSLAPFLPSRTRQNHHRKLLAETLSDHRNSLVSRMEKLGFPRARIATFVDGLSPRPERYVTPGTWRDHPVSFGLRSLWIEAARGGTGSLIMLKGVRDESLLQRAFDGTPWSGYINRVETISRLLGRYRREAGVLILAAYGVILLLLMLRYGPRGGAIAVFPSAAGGALTLATLGLAGVGVNLTHVLALLLILGIGIDYSVFLMEAYRGPQSPRTTMAAIVISALTTAASFGLLAISRASMISTIGLTVLAGITYVLLLCPLVQVTRPASRRSETA